MNHSKCIHKLARLDTSTMLCKVSSITPSQSSAIVSTSSKSIIKNSLLKNKSILLNPSCSYSSSSPAPPPSPEYAKFHGTSTKDPWYDTEKNSWKWRALYIVPAITACLAVWQWKRLNWKLALIAELKTQMSQEPLEIMAKNGETLR